MMESLGKQKKLSPTFALSEFMNATSEMIFLYNEKLKVLDINKAGLKLLGFTNLQQVRGKDILEISPNIKTTGRLGKYKKVIKTGVPCEIEESIFNPHFGEKHFIIKAFRVGKGLGVIASDNTERKEVAQKLHDSQELLSLALNATSDGVWDWNIKTGRVYFSPRWIKSLGYTQDEVPNAVSFWEDIVHPYDMPLVKEAINAHFRGDTPVYKVENRLRKKSGEWRWNLDIGQVVEWDDDGNPVRMVGTDSDITHQKEIALEQRKVLLELEQANKELEEIAYVGSHDLKAPLINLSSLLEIIEDRGGVNGNCKAVFGKVTSCVDQMRETLVTLNEILAFKETKHEKKEKVSFQETIIGVMDSIEDKIKSSGVKISTDFGGCEFAVYQPVYLRSIMLNLLTNAIKFRKPGQVNNVEVKSEIVGNNVCFTIKDNGLGFEMSKQNKLFGLFKRLHVHEEGQGVGLYIVKSIVSSNGGEIEVESKVNIGSTFRIHLCNILDYDNY